RRNPRHQQHKPAGAAETRAGLEWNPCLHDQVSFRSLAFSPPVRWPATRSSTTAPEAIARPNPAAASSQSNPSLAGTSSVRTTTRWGGVCGVWLYRPAAATGASAAAATSTRVACRSTHLRAGDVHGQGERLVERLDRLGRKPAAGERALAVRVCLDSGLAQDDGRLASDHPNRAGVC